MCTINSTRASLTDEIAQGLLNALRGELGNPVILSASSRRPATLSVSLHRLTSMQMMKSYIEASSAILAYTKSIPHTLTKKPQNKFAKPPVNRVNLNSTRSTSQLAMTVLAKPNIVTNLKFRCADSISHNQLTAHKASRLLTLRTCFFPNIAMSLWSAVVPRYFAGTDTSYSKRLRSS